MSDLLENLKAIAALRQEPILNRAVDWIEQLERENAALRKDKERLDYIFWPSYSRRARARMRKIIGAPEYLPGTGLCAWRAGIDAAMREGKQ